MAKYSAKGVIIKYAATATPTTALVNKASVSFDDGDRNLLDSTTHENSVTKSYLDAGLRDTFGINVEVLLDPADTIHELIRSHHAAGTGGYATIVLPDTGAAEWTGPVQVTKYNIGEMTPDGKLMANFRLKFLSAETFTA